MTERALEFWAFGDETRQVSRQQEQERELHSIREFSSGYLELTYNDITKDSRNTLRSPPTLQLHQSPPRINRR